MTAFAPPAPNASTSDIGPGETEPFALRPVVAVAAMFFGLEMAVAARYGYHRDELYFLACARHMAWGYVDQPPFVPAIAWLAGHVFGTSVVGLRVFPALGSAGAVVVTALTARELGGGRRAQWLAAVFAATSAQVLAASHLLSTAAFDMAFWSVITWLVVRVLRTEDRRLWAVIGVVTGVALLNKYNVAFLAGGLVIGLLLSGRRRVLSGWWPWAGAALALAIWSPNIVWNAQHHWASWSMLRSLHSENSTAGASIAFIPAQLIVVGPLLAPVWLSGLRSLFRHAFAKPLAITYLVLLAVYTLSGAKPYYLGGVYFALFAGGGLWAERWLGQSARRSPARLTAAVVSGAVVVMPLTLPVLPVSWQPHGSWEGNINKDLSATVGWRHVAAQIAGVASKLPPAQRSRLVVFTGDYGAAGAVDLYGSRYGLPEAVSGHNSYWWWGPPPPAMDGATTVAVNLDRGYLLTIFDRVVPAGTVDTGQGIWSEELGAPIWVCSGQKLDWARAWPAARHYG